DGARRGAAPRVPQRAASDPDAGGARVRGAPGGHGSDGDDLFLARPRAVHVPERAGDRLSRDHGRHVPRRLDVPGDQPARGHRLSLRRSSGGAVVTAETLAMVLPARPARRWGGSRAIGFLGAAIIVLWGAVALLA